MSPTTTMMCANHPDLPVASFCRTCGKALCASCRRPSGGTVYCDEHLPVVARPAEPMGSFVPPPIPDSPYTAPELRPGAYSANEHPGNAPALAFMLGFIPGVGAIYNGQYAKGLVHAVVFGLLVTGVSAAQAWAGPKPLLGILIGVFVFYMAFEAYHTARRRQSGETIDEFSSLVPMSGSSFPTGAVVLIGLGFLLLANTLDLISMETLVRFWPVGLILIGALMLYSRLRQRGVE